MKDLESVEVFTPVPAGCENNNASANSYTIFGLVKEKTNTQSGKKRRRNEISTLTGSWKGIDLASCAPSAAAPPRCRSVAPNGPGTAIACCWAGCENSRRYR